MSLSIPMFISTSGKQINVLPGDGRTFTLEELQAFVGGHIEIVALDDGRCMVVNEEGKLNGLPINKEATRLFNTPPRVWFDPQVGDVLVCEARWLDTDDDEPDGDDYYDT